MLQMHWYCPPCELHIHFLLLCYGLELPSWLLLSKFVNCLVLEIGRIRCYMMHWIWLKGLAWPNYAGIQSPRSLSIYVNVDIESTVTFTCKHIYGRIDKYIEEKNVKRVIFKNVQIKVVNISRRTITKIIIRHQPIIKYIFIWM